MAKQVAANISGRLRAARNVAVHGLMGQGADVLEEALAQPQRAQRGHGLGKAVANLAARLETIEDRLKQVDSASSDKGGKEVLEVCASDDVDDDEPEGEQVNALEEEASKQCADAKAKIEAAADEAKKDSKKAGDKADAKTDEKPKAPKAKAAKPAAAPAAAAAPAPAAAPAK